MNSYPITAGIGRRKPVWHRQALTFIAVAAVLAMWALAGTDDYHQAVQQQSTYCTYVQNKWWPDYDPSIDCAWRHR